MGARPLSSTPGPPPSDLPPLPGKPRPPYYNESVLLDAYKEAIKGALAAADTAADKILTAAFSLTTAYGALVALAQPKAGSTPIVILLPFLPFACAAVLAVLALLPSVSVAATNELAKVTGAVSGTLA